MLDRRLLSIESILVIGLTLFALGCGGQTDEEFESGSTEARVEQTTEQTTEQGSFPRQKSEPQFQQAPKFNPRSVNPRSAIQRSPATAATKQRSGSGISAAPSTSTPPAIPRTGDNAPFSMQPLPRQSAVMVDRQAEETAGEAGQPIGQHADLPDMAVQADGDKTDAAHADALTTIKVFYATDRKSRQGIEPGDWFRIHLLALIAGVVYLIAFALVFLVSRKVLVGIIAFGSLAVFLFFAQSATVEWQKLKRLERNDDPEYLSDIRSSGKEALDYGSCEVTIPPSHQTGRLDSPSVLRFEFAENPQNHVVLHRVIRTDKDEFYDEMLQVMDQGRSRQGLVFIHGYNVSFDDAVKRTAQIAHDLEFDGAPICYSWSSRGSLANYTHDMANADATVLALQSFLEETVRRTGNSTIHLIAHSMGNRALLQAIDRIAVSDQGNQGMFGQLIMAAPDVSERDFRNRYVVAARQLARAVTLYASSRDRALIASAEIHGHNRAGLAGEHLILVDGVDTIDVSEIDTSLIGHSYYGDHPELIRDLRALVELSRPASQRTWLKQIFSPGGFGYFRFADLLGRTPTDHTAPSERR